MKQLARFTLFLFVTGAMLLGAALPASGAAVAEQQPTPQPIIIRVDKDPTPTPDTSPPAVPAPAEPGEGGVTVEPGLEEAPPLPVDSGMVGVKPDEQSTTPLAAQLLSDEQGVTVNWVTTQPTEGMILYGSDPFVLDQQAQGEKAAAALEHNVTIAAPQPDSPLYFVIVVDGLRYDDNGWPFKVSAGEWGRELSAVPVVSASQMAVEGPLLPDSPNSLTAPAACPPVSCTAGRDVGRDYFVQVVQRLNNVPYNDFAVSALQAWEPHENTSACWNPLATTRKMSEICNFNSVGVQNYQSKDMGTQATAETLNLGYYDAIRRMMRLESFDREALRGALGTWGTCRGSTCDPILNKWKDLYDNQGRDPDDDRTIAQGQTLQGTISPANDTDVYYFEGRRGQTVTISMNKSSGSGLDSYLYLYAPDGSRIAHNDDSGGNYNARLVKQLPQSGRYRIEAKSWASRSTGAYTLQLQLRNDTCATGRYKAQYYNNRYLNGSPVLTRCESSILKNWRGGSPSTSVPSDNFSARWVGYFNFTEGEYIFTAEADDGIRVWLDGTLLINQWHDQPPTTYRAAHRVSAGRHRVKVEYYEREGGAVAKVWWERNQRCSNQYKAEYWRNISLSGSPTVTRCEGWPINHDWGGGSPGGDLPADNFSARWTGEASISAGTYKFIARADDGIRVWLDGNLIINAWQDQSPTTYTATRSVSSGVHQIKVEYYERGGGAVAQFRWERVQSSGGNIARGRPARASSQESSSYAPPKGNDGSSSTRWSSRISSTLGNQFWIADLGSAKTFNRVRINWETAYAAYYIVAWSYDGQAWYYFPNSTVFTRSSPGWGDHTFPSRTARYVGVFMYTRAPRMNNFSFFEFEAYGPAAQRALESPEEPDMQEVVLPNQVDE